MSVRTIDPAYMSVQEWADNMVPALEQFGNLGRLWSEDEWRNWAAQLLNLPALSGSIVPDPYDYEDWRMWAQRLNQNLAEIA